MLDLQMNVQTVARCTARMVIPNLTACTPAVYHPSTVLGPVVLREVCLVKPQGRYYLDLAK